MRYPNRFFPATGGAVAALAVALPAAALAAGDHGRSYGHPGTPGEVDRTVRVEAANMHFEPDRIRITPGQTVRFVVRNTGDTRHEFTIGPPKVQQAHRKEMRQASDHGHGGSGEHGHDAGHDAGGQAEGHHGDSGHGGEQGHHGGESQGHGHANSVMVRPGETKELIWHFTKVEGLRFGCNVPGHYPAGMHGPFVRRE